MNKIIERLYVGDTADALNKADDLYDYGITAVMNATPQTDNISGDSRFHYIRLDQQDGQPIPREKIEMFLGWMIRGVREQRITLIHCAAGISRAATFAITWLMYCGFGWDEAEEIIRVKRPQINPNPLLKQSILEFFNRRDA